MKFTNSLVRVTYAIVAAGIILLSSGCSESPQEKLARQQAEIQANQQKIELALQKNQLRQIEANTEAIQAGQTQAQAAQAYPQQQQTVQGAPGYAAGPSAPVIVNQQPAVASSGSSGGHELLAGVAGAAAGYMAANALNGNNGNNRNTGYGPNGYGGNSTNVTRNVTINKTYTDSKPAPSATPAPTGKFDVKPAPAPIAAPKPSTSFAVKPSAPTTSFASSSYKSPSVSFRPSGRR